jgi:hypothetical protein
LEKDDFFNESDGTPELNENGHTYLIKWPSKGFVFPPGSFSVPTNGQALSLEGTVQYAEWTVQQTINWLS